MWGCRMPRAACRVPGAGCLVPRARCLVPGASCPVPRRKDRHVALELAGVALHSDHSRTRRRSRLYPSGLWTKDQAPAGRGKRAREAQPVLTKSQGPSASTEGIAKSRRTADCGLRTKRSQEVRREQERVVATKDKRSQEVRREQEK